MKTILYVLVSLMAMPSAFAATDCSDEILAAIQQTDGRQSPNCTYDGKADSTGPGAVGTVDVSCPAYIPLNPQAKAPTITVKYQFDVAPNSCEVQVKKLSSRAEYHSAAQSVVTPKAFTGENHACRVPCADPGCYGYHAACE